MTSTMLATYPDVFAGGAIIAGLPYGVAVNVPQAMERMRGSRGPALADLSALVRAASPHDGPWPTVSVWHGSGDATVNPTNADAIVAQWRGIHGVPEAPSKAGPVDGYPRRAWADASGRTVIEEYTITGMGHGTPLDMSEPDPVGAAGAFMLEARISSTRHIAAFWGLTKAAAAKPKPATSEADTGKALTKPRVIRPTRIPEPVAAPISAVGKIIEDALRSAGLMR